MTTQNACITLCSCRIVVQFGTAVMRHISRSLEEGQQPRLCWECLCQTGDVNASKSEKNVQELKHLYNTTLESRAIVKINVKNRFI